MANLSTTPAENRERAFLIWYSLGMNDTKTVVELKKLGLSVTRQTISAWKVKYAWQQRAENLDIKKLSANNITLTFEQTLLEDLKHHKDRYDSYFESLPNGKVDNQAMYVYAQLTKQILDLTSKYKPKAQKVSKGLSNETAESIKSKILGY